MQYNDEDEEANLFYQKYQKNKTMNSSIKPKANSSNAQSSKQPSLKLIQQKRERHDSSSSEDSEEDKDNQPQIVDSTAEAQPQAHRPVEFSLRTVNNKLLPEDIEEKLFNRKDKKKEKQKRMEDNYAHLSSWAKGIIQLEKREKKEERDVIKESLDPMKGLLNIECNTQSSKGTTAERGFYLPKCKFSQSINRFGIEPGYRWDGVDRSTGFERRYLEKINERQERTTEYFKLRTEDM